MNIEKNNKSTIRAWTMYDWANSVYNLSICSAIFPTFYENNTKTVSMEFLGMPIKNTVLYTLTLSAAFLIISFIVPLLSGLADYSGKRKSFMRFFVILGSIGCSALFWFEGTNYIFGMACFFLATIGWAGSLVFYNSYLPEIATEDKFDQVSARGFTMGYIGSVLMLIINLLMIIFHDKLGFENKKIAAQTSFLLVGLWWILWSLWPLLKLPNTTGKIASKNSAKNPEKKGSLILNGYREIFSVWQKVKRMGSLKMYLLAFAFITMGVQTVMYVAALFGKNELQLEDSVMLPAILCIQLIGVAGAYFFAWLADQKGNKYSLSVTLIVWIGICIGAYFMQKQNSTQFIILACVVGTVMGGVQALCRATFAKLIPGDKDNTSFFSFYEVTEKVSIVIGTAIFAGIDSILNMRESILSLIVFFALGFAILALVKSPRLAKLK